MSQQSNREAVAMRYLLGNLSEDERARLEEQYFSDDELFEEVEIAEEELIDRYVRGELSREDHERFEQHLSDSPRLMERKQFAQMFADRVSTTPGIEAVAAPISRETKGRDKVATSSWRKFAGILRQPTFPRLTFAIAVLVLLVGGAALFAGWLQLREASRRLTEEQTALEQRKRELDKRAADINAQAEHFANQNGNPPPVNIDSPPKQVETPERQNRTFVAFLSPGTTRGSNNSQDLVIPSGTSEIELTLGLQDTEHVSYTVTIVTPEQTRVFTKSDLRAQRTRGGRVLTFRVPSNRIPPNDYVVRVDGRTLTGRSESVEDYSFRIVK